LFFLTKNHEYHKEKFNQRPFFKLLFNLIYDIKRREYNFQDNEINDFFNVFIKLFNKLQPLKYPGFSFSWLELISNSNFMSTILANFTLEYHYLILDLMRFFKRLINETTIEKEFFKTFYKGTLRVLLVLLHDFPEFLSKFAYSFCEEIPDQFIQLRNIILASFPKTMRPPDPFYVNNLDQIEELKQFPIIYTSCFESKFFELNLHNDFNNYLQYKNEVTFRQIWSKFFFNSSSTVINVSVVNSFIVIIPWMIYSKSKPNLTQVEELKNESHVLLAKLLKQENLEMREVILNAIFNQISYPNIITNYFIEFILSMFVDFDSESIHEQITRVFAERLIIEKPHPWGLIYTFIELIRNSKYNFKKKSNDNVFEAIFSKVFKTIVTNNQDLAN
jgi:CCR4-NOT transcription complex subunit 1